MAADAFQQPGRVLAVRPQGNLAAHPLQFGRHLVEFLLRVLAAQRAAELVADLHELRLVDDQLAGKVHQMVEPIDINADGLDRPLPGVGSAGFVVGTRPGGRCRIGAGAVEAVPGTAERGRGCAVRQEPA